MKSLEENTPKGRYLTFRLAEEDYGLEILHVTDISGFQNNRSYIQRLEKIGEEVKILLDVNKFLYDGESIKTEI